jgi:hypothetical protein
MLAFHNLKWVTLHLALSWINHSLTPTGSKLCPNQDLQDLKIENLLHIFNIISLYSRLELFHFTYYFFLHGLAFVLTKIGYEFVLIELLIAEMGQFFPKRWPLWLLDVLMDSLKDLNPSRT